MDQMALKLIKLKTTTSEHFEDYSSPCDLPPLPQLKKSQTLSISTNSVSSEDKTKPSLFGIDTFSEIAEAKDEVFEQDSVSESDSSVDSEDILPKRKKLFNWTKGNRKLESLHNCK